MQMLIEEKISLICLYCAVGEAPSLVPRPHGWFWLQLNSSFLNISWFPKHLFFFFPALRTCSFTAAKWSFTSCVGEQDAFPWISHARGFNCCCISFGGCTIIIHHNLLVPGFLKWNTTKYHQLLSNWKETPCLRWKKSSFHWKKTAK